MDWEALDVDRQTVLNRIWTKADKDGNDRVSFQEFWHLVSAARSRAPSSSALVSLLRHGVSFFQQSQVFEQLPRVSFSLMG